MSLFLLVRYFGMNGQEKLPIKEEVLYESVAFSDEAAEESPVEVVLLCPKGDLIDYRRK